MRSVSPIRARSPTPTEPSFVGDDDE